MTLTDAEVDVILIAAGHNEKYIESTDRVACRAGYAAAMTPEKILRAADAMDSMLLTPAAPVGDDVRDLAAELRDLSAFDVAARLKSQAARIAELERENARLNDRWDQHHISAWNEATERAEHAEAKLAAARCPICTAWCVCCPLGRKGGYLDHVSR